MTTVLVVTHKLTLTDGQGRVNAEMVASTSKHGYHVEAVACDMAPELVGLSNVRWHPVLLPKWVPSALLRYQCFALCAGRIVSRLPAIDILQLNGAIIYGGCGGVNVANFVHGDWLCSPYHPIHGRSGFNAVYQYLFTRLNAMWEKRAFDRAECVVAVSNQVRDALINRVGVPPEKIQVIEPGVDLQQFHPLQSGEPNVLRDELQLEPGTFILMFVGDIRSNRKNLDLVLTSMVRLPSSVHVAVVGDETRSPYPAMAQKLGLSARAHFLGRRTADLPALLRGADAFVFPSHYDPFALVVTEAMASGLPVVTAPTVGAAALIQDGVNGFVLPHSSDVDAMVKVLDLLCKDAPLCASVGKAARATAEKHSWAAMTERYEDLYRRLLASREDNLQKVAIA